MGELVEPGRRGRDAAGGFAHAPDLALEVLEHAVEDLGHGRELVPGRAAAAEGDGQAPGEVAVAAREAGIKEMVASVTEIATTAQTTAGMTREAVRDAALAQETIQRLSSSSDEIGTVATLIASIAAKTNLLALNATIEAARAGEHGRGFAVVASEVKDLARQTAEATDGIKAKIAAIQSGSGDAANAVERIVKAIEGINKATVATAGAVEEQSATNKHMSELIAAAVAKSRSIAASMAAVDQAVHATAQDAQGCESAAATLAHASSDLAGVVGAFRY